MGVKRKKEFSTLKLYEKEIYTNQQTRSMYLPLTRGGSRIVLKGRRNFGKQLSRGNISTQDLPLSFLKRVGVYVISARRAKSTTATVIGIIKITKTKACLVDRVYRETFFNLLPQTPHMSGQYRGM